MTLLGEPRKPGPFWWGQRRPGPFSGGQVGGGSLAHWGEAWPIVGVAVEAQPFLWIEAWPFLGVVAEDTWPILGVPGDPAHSRGSRKPGPF